MPRGFTLQPKLRNHKITKLRNHQRGYMLITLMLALALITIALLTALPEVGQQIRRDREDEMRHRGTAYMRAIQHFYKKFGRYPMRIEELEDTNNLRFIRKRYTDPLNVDKATGKEKDFKLLHQQDITLNSGMVLGQAPGQNVMGGPGGLPGQAGGQLPGGLSGAAAQAGLAALQGAGGLGGQIGGMQQSVTQAPAEDSDDADAEGKPNSPGSSPSNSGSGSSASSNSGPGLSGPTFGGGPILGVASTSKAKSIRVFYDKNHYNDWLFIYVPQGDRGGLLTGPVNPGMPSGNVGGAMPGQPIVGGQIGGPGQGQGLTPNAGQTSGTTSQPQQNSGQTPPEQ
jgi:type II secretory pathway pseudopilin PulG